MPIVNSSYYNSPVPKEEVFDELYNNNPSTSDNSYSNTSVKQYEIMDIIYANTTQGMTARRIYDKFIKTVPELVGSCGIDEDFFLNALEDEITLFTAMGQHKWNFLSVEQNISLNGQIRHYVLPSHFDQMIAVWINANSRLNNTGRKLEIVEIDEQKKNFVNGVNFYSRKGYQIEFINLNYNTTLCNHCGYCDNCNHYSGTVNLHYHIKPQAPKTLDETMHWFPAHPNLLPYFVGRIKDIAYEKAGMPPVINSKLTTLWNDLLGWDMNYMPAKNKLGNDTKLFNFKKVFNHRRGY